MLNRFVALALAVSTLAQAQAVEVREASLVLPSGDVRAVDGGVWIPEPEFSAYVRACSTCQRDSAAKPDSSPSSGVGLAVAVTAGAALLLFVGGVVLGLTLKAP